MAKTVIRNLGISRHQLANPHNVDSLHQRLVAKGAIDLRDNRINEDLGNGYRRVVPKDPSKRYT